MNDNGFETLGNLFILLEKIDPNHYKYITTINKNFLANIGYSFIDTIFSFTNRTFMIGKSIGGDAGDEWGVIWIGIWNNSGNLDLRYYKKWENYAEDTVTNEYFYHIDNAKNCIDVYQTSKKIQSELIKLDSLANF